MVTKPKDWRYLEFFAPITVEEGLHEKTGRFTIKGTAINSTTTLNGHTFLSEELEVSAKTLVDKPFLKDHKNEVDSLLGRVLSARYNPLTQSVEFEAYVREPKYQDMIRDGTLKNVSVGAFVKEVEESDDKQTAILRGINFVELSATPIPADQGADFAMAVMCALQLKKETMTPTVVESQKVTLTPTVDVSQSPAKAEEKNTMAEEIKTETPQVDILAEMKKLMAEQAVSIEKKFDEKIELMKPKVTETKDETKGVVNATVAEEETNYLVQRTGKGHSITCKAYDSRFKSYQHSGNKIAAVLRGN